MCDFFVNPERLEASFDEFTKFDILIASPRAKAHQLDRLEGLAI